MQCLKGMFDGIYPHNETTVVADNEFAAGHSGFSVGGDVIVKPSSAYDCGLR